jgi:hypothetical protein
LEMVTTEGLANGGAGTTFWNLLLVQQHLIILPCE